MAAGDMSGANMVRYDIDSVVRGQHVYKTVWTLVIGEQLYLEKESGNPHDDFAVAVIKDHQIVGHIPEDFLRITWHSNSIIQVPGIYFCLSALTPRRLHETKCLYETSRNLRQYGITLAYIRLIKRP